ncbi:MAG: pyridoxal phosphate-dependent aminotransferase [Egibacteraceae bacterium]
MSTLSSSTGVSQRLEALSGSATLAISAKAVELRAYGHDVIGFGAGEPDFPTPDHVVRAAEKACADPVAHHYTPAGGLPALREAIVRKTERESGLVASPEEVLVCNGGKHALYNVFQALIDPGDQVLLPAPYWVSYPEQVRLAGGRVVSMPTTAAGDFRVTVEQLDEAWTPQTKALIFVSPSNPTGAVYAPDEVEAIGRWAVERGIWVVTDEIYEHLVYGDATFASMPVRVPELRERCVVVNGVAKTYAMTGWRVGWSIAPVTLTKAMTRLQSHLCSNVANVSQRAALAAVEGPLDVVETMRTAYDRRRRVARELLDGIEGVHCPLPEGAFYAFPSFEALLGTAVGDQVVETSAQLCTALLKTAQVALVPGEGFGAPGYARVSYALADDDLRRGLERMAEVLGR